VDGRSDIYSLGVVGFVTLSGRLPFEAPDTAGMLAMHIAKPAPALASLAAGVPGRLARVVDRCLAKSPADRFPSGEAVAEAVAETADTKRELPVPLRVWLKKGGDLRTPLLVWYFFLGPSVSAIIGMSTSLLLGTLPGLLMGLASYVGLPLVFVGGQRAWHLRRLLAAGYGLEDARLAVRDHAEKRREELTFEFGAKPPLWARLSYVTTLGLSAAAVASFIGMLVTASPTSEGAGFLVASTLVCGAGALAGFIVHRIRPGRSVTKDSRAELRLKFWSSRFARWLEQLARIGLKRKAAPAELTYRPTELALGLAAGALFDSLSREQKRELKTLPALITRLERDAALMRKTVDELGSAVASLGADAVAARSRALQDPAAAASDSALADARDTLREDLAKRRDHAAQRLAAAVTSLENIRLSLLRLKAGAASVSELTADLAAAAQMEDAMAFAAAAREEVEGLLAATPKRGA
jgi:serine/threonine-protein kinase